jgi:hypothetical protein
MIDYSRIPMTRPIAIILCLLPISSLKADGYPFDHRTNEVTGSNLRLPLDEAQQVEVASRGRITFTNDQLDLLRLFYPKIPKKLRVIASTFNDGLDERDPNPVDCIWTKPTEVGITLHKRWGMEDYSFDSTDGMADSADIRISPTGILYHQGNEIGLETAFEIVRTARKPDGDPATERPIVSITRPPPFRSADEEETANNRKADDLFTSLAKYGESVKVTVLPTW